MSYTSHAIREFSKVNITKDIQETILELLQIFSEQGHSGFSASFGKNLFQRMSKFNNIEDVKKDFITIGYKPIEECEDDPDKWLQKGTIDLLNNLYNKNHSHKDKELIVKYFCKLCMHEPIAPIMCTDDEWNDISESMGGNTHYQNNRCSAVFKENECGKPYYLDAIIWKNQNGSTYTGSAFNSRKEKITSSQTIKLPFNPKRFYIDVIDYEIAPDDWESFIKDENQLKEVWKYYEHQETPSYLRYKKLKSINEKFI